MALRPVVVVLCGLVVALHGASAQSDLTETT